MWEGQFIPHKEKCNHTDVQKKKRKEKRMQRRAQAGTDDRARKHTQAAHSGVPTANVISASPRLVHTLRSSPPSVSSVAVHSPPTSYIKKQECGACVGEATEGKNLHLCYCKHHMGLQTHLLCLIATTDHSTFFVEETDKTGCRQPTLAQSWSVSTRIQKPAPER